MDFKKFRFKYLSVFILLQLIVQPVAFGQTDAGIINPTNGLVIHKYNYSSYIPNADDDMQVDGWSNPGNISNIKVYNNGYFAGYANNPNSGSWDKMVGLSAGTNNIHINVRCNYNGCLLAGTDSPIRTVTYMKPLNPTWITSDESAGTIKVEWNKHTATGTSGFHYRVYRNTVDNPNTASIPGSTWTTSDEFIDHSVVPGVTYYYWVICASNSSGQNPSPFGDSKNGMLSLPDLDILSKSVATTSLAPGESVSTTCTVRNIGTTAPSSTLGYYLSIDNALDGSDVALGTDAIGSLNYAQSSAQNKTLTIPANTMTGTYYILFSVDDQSAIAEDNEGNNVQAVQINVAPPTASFNQTIVNVDENSGTSNFTISNTGNGTLTWTAVPNDNWLTISSGASGLGSGTVSIDYSTNSAYNTRQGTVTVTTNDPSNPSITLTVNQAAARCSNNYTVVTYPTAGTQLTGIIKIDGTYATSDDYILAFVNGECRANTSIIMNNGISYISTVVTGNGAETATLKVLDVSTCTLVDVCPDIQISSGSSVGSGTTEFYAYTTLPVASVTIQSDDADNSIMNNDLVSFTATPTNGGNTPTYQWKKNGSNVGTNSNTYSDNGLQNGDQITCEMTTSMVCASPTISTSNSLMFAVVPVELVKFEGRNTTEGNLLEWITSSEINNKGFEIQKSNDKVKFETIGFVDGKGNSLEINKYNYLDVNVQGVLTYYRLKQIDFDEKFEYSNIISITHPSTNQALKFVTYPNPTNGEIQISAEFMTPLNEIQIEIVGVDGKILRTIKLGNDITAIKQTLSLDGLANDNYFIVLRSVDKVIVKQQVLLIK